MIIDDLPSISIANDSDEIAIEQGTATKKITKGNFLQEVTSAISSLLSSLSGKVSKAGDTMNGELIVQNSAISEKNTTADTTDDAPASTTYWDTKHTDKNNRVAAYWETSYSTNGLSRTVFRARRNVNGSNINNGFALEVNKNGERFVSFDDPATWREALGLGTNGAFPISISQGGTGSTAVASTSTISQIVTAATGFTFSSPSFLQWGKIGVFRIGITKNVSWSGAQNPGTVVSGKRTITQCALVCYTSPYITGMLDPNGTITINSATTVNANVTHYFYAIYFLA